MSYTAKSGPQPRTEFQKWLAFSIHNYPSFRSPPNHGGDSFNKWAIGALKNKTFNSPPHTVLADDRGFNHWFITELKKAVSHA